MRTVDIVSKLETYRRARAYGRIRLSPKTVKLIKKKALPKGDLVEATKLAGIMGAKRTGELLPFCHPIPLDFVEVALKVKSSGVEVFSEVRGIAKTGYEMEALTAVSVALLNIYDMCKGVDSGILIEEIKLTHKEGGKSDWGTDLRGVGVGVRSQSRELGDLVLSYLKGLGAKESPKPRLLVVVGERAGVEEELRALECVVALYDMRRNPLSVGEEIRIGRDKRGRLIVSLPAVEEKIRLFFETFGGLLGGLL